MRKLYCTRCLVLASLALLTGCQTARVANPLTHTVGGNAPDQQIEFWHRLADRPVTSNDEAFHGLLLFVDNNEDPASTYSARVAALQKRGLLASNFNEPGDAAIERGTLAVALTKVLRIRGGLFMHLLGPTPRYAVREMQYLDLFPPSSENQTFSGPEFLGIMAKAVEYQHSPTSGSESAVGTKQEPLRGKIAPPTTQEGPGAEPYPPKPVTPASPQSPIR